MLISVTVDTKPPTHPFYNKGSKLCFYLNGVPGALLQLTGGTQYTFQIDTVGHPFYLTFSEKGGSEDNGMLTDFPPTEKGVVVYEPSATLPDDFYYQCRIHEYMGGPAIHNTFRTTQMITDLVAPTSLSSPNNYELYCADQIGLVYRINLITQIVSIFLDVREYTPSLNPKYEERGLLGLCFHPQYNSNGRFFIFYSSKREYAQAERGQSRVSPQRYYNCLSEFFYDRRLDRVDYKREKVILRIPRELDYHNGGKIGFGADGYLYITVGDGGPQEDPQGNAQNLNTCLGKILRIDVNGIDIHPYYRIPPGNPFIHQSNALPEIWAYGFRNPWGLEFSGDVLIVTDAGYEAGSGQEEVNIVQRGGNYGWNTKQGTHISPWIKDPAKTRNTIDPVFAYTTADPQFSDSTSSVIIGGYMDKSGDYICADYSGRLIRLRFGQSLTAPSGSTFGEQGSDVIETASVNKWIRSFGKVGDQIYLLTSEQQGPVGNTGEIIKLDVM